MAIDHRCRWVRDRLPLLAGGDLAVEERRRAERHLIGCPDCRDCRDSALSALSALRLAASVSPARPDAPSLWPSLARQIRESRHVAPRPSWWDVAASRLLAPRPGLALGLGLGGLLAAAVSLGRPSPQVEAPSALVELAEAGVDVRPGPVSVSAFPSAPIGVASAARPADLKPIEPPSTLQFNYDLDHGTPLGSGARDSQHSY